MGGSVQLATEEHEDGRVGWLYVNRPEKLNALTTAMTIELTEQALSLSGLTDLRAVVLTGVGSRSFIAGADVHELAALSPPSAAEFVKRLHEANDALRSLPVPVIAMINGHCLGAGMEMAASCDIRIASRSASFGMPEALVGLPSVIEAVLLPGLVGWGKASDLMLTGDPMNAEEAKECGFVQRLCDDEDLKSTTTCVLQSILASGPRAIRLQKKLFREWETRSLSQAVEISLDYMSEAYYSDEPKTLLGKILDRRLEPAI